MQGVLPSQSILDLVSKKQLTLPEPSEHVQPNSIDLPLGCECWRLSSIRAPRKHETVKQVIAELAIDELDLIRPRILERNAVYVCKLDASVALPKDISAVTDAKSSTGRIDVQVRLMTDHNEHFDTIPSGYHGPLYLFISSNSFLIRVQQGLRLNQARFCTGNPELSDEEAQKLAKEKQLLFVNRQAIEEVDAKSGVILHLDLKQPIAGYRAKFTNHVVDLTRLDNPKELFWEEIRGEDPVTLERNQFYILSTIEAIRIPPEVCAWIPPFRPEFGEFRSHYAGFFDSGFGWGKDGELQGSTTTLEVRSQDNSLTLVHGTPIAPVVFLKMQQKPHVLYNVHMKSNYQSQSGPRLSKYFK